MVDESLFIVSTIAPDFVKCSDMWEAMPRSAKLGGIPPPLSKFWFYEEKGYMVYISGVEVLRK